MTDIKDIGGEFALIDRIKGDNKDAKVVVGIGDDCSVLEIGGEEYMLVTTDMIVEKDHFRTEWSSPFQIGVKLMSINISDIAAMGGKPKYCVVAGCLTKDVSVEFVEEMFRGMKSVGDKLGVEIIGGDTTHGGSLVFNLTMIGFVEKDKLCLRSGAKKNDLILVSGYLGRSTAGLNLLLDGVYEGEDVIDHKEPKHRLDVSSRIAGKVNAMIDISDGLASEVKHICRMSNVGAIVYKEKIPIKECTLKSASLVGKDAYDFALNGGEDFELLFTVSENVFEENKDLFKDCFVVGKIIDKEDGIWLIDGEKKEELGKGYDHFET